MATKKTPPANPQAKSTSDSDIEDIANTSDVHLRAEKIKKFGIPEYLKVSGCKLIHKVYTNTSTSTLYHDKYGLAWLVGTYLYNDQGGSYILPANPNVFSADHPNVLLVDKKDDVKEMVVSFIEFMKSRQKSLNPLESPKVDLETEEGIQQMESLLESAKKELLEKKKAASKVSKVTGNQVELSPALQDILKAPKIDMDSLVKRVILEAAKMSLKK